MVKSGKAPVRTLVNFIDLSLRQYAFYKIEFKTPGDMWSFIKANRGKVINLRGGGKMWWTVEKSEEERQISKRVT